MLRTTLIALILVLAAWPAPVRAQAAPSRMLVVPFEDASTDPSLHWLGEACAVLVADGLRQQGLPVIPRSDRVKAYDELNLPTSATLSRATVIKVAELLGARELVVGSYTVKDGELTVTASRIRVDAGRVQSPVTERGALTELFDVYDRVARRLTGATPAAAASTERPPLGAFENFVKGLLAESLATRATFLESALAEYPTFERARIALWDVRTGQSDHAAALAAVSPIPDSSPLAYGAHFRAALSLLQLGRHDAAFEAFTGLLSAGAVPTRAAAVHNNLGLIQLRRGAPHDAGSAPYFLTQATDEDPGDPDYCFNLGYTYLLEKNLNGAIYWLREVLRRDPADADAHYVLAAALQATGSAVEAGRERDLARQLSTRYEEMERAARTDRQAVPRGLERLQMEPDGSGALRAGQIVVSSAQREQREMAVFHLERGRRLYQREQDTEALAELRRAVYLSPYQADAHLLMGRIYLRAGRPAEAIVALKISVWSADTAPARVALAEAYLRIEDVAAARAEVARALALDPASEAARRLMAEIK
jgi:Tfp pilus assembly protein PilF/TolB-like protein